MSVDRGSTGGYVYLSAVGFNKTRTRAMVLTGYYCNNLCAGSRVHLLTRIDGTWQEAVVPGIRMCVIVS